jgi:hypothetical protein
MSARSSWATAPSTWRENNALRGGGIDRIMQAAEMGAARFELLDYREQVTDGAGEAIEPDHDQRLAPDDLP